MKVPGEVIAAVAEFDSREDTFIIRDVHNSVTRSIEREAIEEENRRGYWAEMAAFGFNVRPTQDGGPWKTYFQPAMTFLAKDGTPIYGPDIAEADADTIAYWSERAKEVTHPILAARYADLVWDFSKLVTGKGPDIEFARLAIDSYIDALKMDNGEAWGDNRRNVERVLKIALSLKDSSRIVATVEAVIDYADRTSDDGKLGTYCYLFDLLLPAKKGPSLTEEQEQHIIDRFEERFAAMTKPVGPYDVDPHFPRNIGLRLADYYKRKGRDEERSRTLAEIGKAFERCAKVGNAMRGMLFLDNARKFYVEAGQPKEAERVLREAQEMAPHAKKGMAKQTFEFGISNDDRQKFLDALVAGGVKKGLVEWAVAFLPRQDELKKQMEEHAREFPLQALFPPTILGDEGVKAKVDDTRGDPDGPMIHETSKRMALSTVWMSWGLDHLIEHGLTSEMYADFISESPVFLEDRLSLITRGIEAHMRGDYVQSIHVLVPQIERALVGLVFRLGGAATKPHRTGRGVVQSKSLNDALADDATRNVLGPDLTIYLAATLSHPKGHNIRNEVCHGLWGPEAFTKQASVRVLHAMTALSLLRAIPKQKSEQEEPNDGGENDDQ